MVWCPISPAAPRGPSRSWRSTTTPPPTPVPSVKKIIVRASRPRPNTNSPNVAARASFSRYTGQPIFGSRVARTGTSRHWVGKLGRNFVTPLARSTRPGTPIPRAAGRVPACLARSLITAAIRSSTGPGPSWESVGCLASAMIRPSLSAMAALTFVPPRSTLANKALMGQQFSFR